MNDTSQQSPRELLLRVLKSAWEYGYSVAIGDAGDGGVFVAVEQPRQITVLPLSRDLVVEIYRGFQRMSDIRVDLMQAQESHIICFTLSNDLALNTFVLSPDLFNDMRAPSSDTASPTDDSDASAEPPLPPAAN